MESATTRRAELTGGSRRGPAAAPAALGALLGAAAIAAAHAYADGRPELAGPVLVLDHIFQLAAAGGLLVLCAAVGLRAAASPSVAFASALERLLFALPLGAGFVGTLLLLLGAAGGFHVGWTAALLLACGAVARRELRALPDLARRGATELVELAGWPSLSVFLAVVAAMVLLALAPATDWDSLMYHLRIPAQFVERGAVHVPADNLHVSFVGLLHLLYVPLLMVGASEAPALLNVAFSAALAVAVLIAGARLFTPAAGRFASVLLWGSPVLVLSGVTPRTDLALACYLVLGHYALLRAWRDVEGRAGWLVVGGALLGFAVGVKYLALGYLAALAPVAALVALDPREKRKEAAVALAACGVAALAAALPWLLKNQVLLGAPLYPELTDAVLPPWLAELHGARAIPASVDPAALHPMGDIRQPFSLVDWFLAPERMTPEAEGTAYVANRGFLVLPFAVLLVRSRAFVAVLAPAVLFIAAVLIHNTSLNLRYLVPALPALTLAAGVLIAGAAARTSSRAWRIVLALLVAGVALAPTASAVGGRLAGSGVLELVAGLTSEADHLRDPRNGESAGYLAMADAVNARTSPDHRILMLFEARGLRFESETLQDNILTNWPLLLPLVDGGGCLARSDVTHVLVATGVLGYFRLRGLDPATIGWDGFPAFAERCLTRIASGPGWVLYVVGQP